MFCRKHGICSADDCTNQVRAKGLCAEHGECSEDGCTNQAKARGFAENMEYVPQMIAQPILEQEVFAENMDPRKGGLRYGIRRREAMSVNYYVGVISISRLSC